MKEDSTLHRQRGSTSCSLKNGAGKRIRLAIDPAAVPAGRMRMTGEGAMVSIRGSGKPLMAALLFSAALAFQAGAQGQDSPAGAPSAEATANAAHDSPEDTVTAAVLAWSKAWADGDVPAYLACYTPDFSPSAGVSHAQWVRQRTAHIKGSGHITIKIGTVNVEVFDVNVAQASFQQQFHSDVYNDQAIKVLYFTLVDGKWKISGESGMKDKFQ
jgi:ketosteroid isomerase-like protein